MNIPEVRDAVAQALCSAGVPTEMNVHAYPPASVTAPCVLLLDRAGPQGLAVEVVTLGRVWRLFLTARFVVPAQFPESAARMVDEVRSGVRLGELLSASTSTVAANVVMRVAGWEPVAAVDLASVLAPVVGVVPAQNAPMFVADLPIDLTITDL